MVEIAVMEWFNKPLETFYHEDIHRLIKQWESCPYQHFPSHSSIHSAIFVVNFYSALKQIGKTSFTMVFKGADLAVCIKKSNTESHDNIQNSNKKCQHTQKKCCMN